MFVVSGVTRVHLGRAVTSQQRGERFVNQGCFRRPRPQPSGVLEESRIDRGAQTCASHAIIMPRVREGWTRLVPEDPRADEAPLEAPDRRDGVVPRRQEGVRAAAGELTTSVLPEEVSDLAPADTLDSTAFRALIREAADYNTKQES